MRVSEYYKLGRTQPTLDFVDVDLDVDTRIFVDPQALRLLPSQWATEGVHVIQHFFRTVLDAIREGKHARARSLLGELSEPNETRLGMSVSGVRGRAVGRHTANAIWDNLRQSAAVKSGLLRDLEDSALLIPGIGVDIISDITTNLIRGKLIEYTNYAAQYYGIRTERVASGSVWNTNQSKWTNFYADLPRPPNGKLLLVPKAIVRLNAEINPDQYLRDYILTYLQEEELKANSDLVRLLKDGRRRVTKKDVKAKFEERFGSGKELNLAVTKMEPDLLTRYHSDKSYRPDGPLEHWRLAMSLDTPPPDWDAMLAALKALPPGKDASTEFEKSVESLLSALFYPSLSHPELQSRIHAGRKRIDIQYTNHAVTGFFRWLADHYTAPLMFVECKNYSSDPGNPELDQLSGRFSPSRGKVGILVCRTIEDKELFLTRCRDTAQDMRGYIIPLDFSDLGTLVAERKANADSTDYRLLRERFSSLIL